MADALFIFESQYSSYKSTLKDTSLDKHHTSVKSEYLCKNKTQIVYDFDKIVNEKYREEERSSFDALLIDERNIYCIEFKNQKYSDVDTPTVQKKIIDGRNVLDDIFSSNNIQKREYKFIYCVVYKNHPPKWRRGITKNIIQFELEQYKGKYFDEIYTNDISYFTNEYKKHFQKELVC